MIRLYQYTFLFFASAILQLNAVGQNASIYQNVNQDFDIMIQIKNPESIFRLNGSEVTDKRYGNETVTFYRYSLMKSEMKRYSVSGDIFTDEESLGDSPAKIDIAFLGFQPDGIFNTTNIKPNLSRDRSVLLLLSKMLRTSSHPDVFRIYAFPYNKMIQGLIPDEVFNTRPSRVLVLIVNERKAEFPEEFARLPYIALDPVSKQIKRSSGSDFSNQNTISGDEGKHNNTIKINPQFYYLDLNNKIQSTLELEYLAYKYIEDCGVQVNEKKIDYTASRNIVIPDNNEKIEAIGLINQSINDYVKTTKVRFDAVSGVLYVKFVLKSRLRKEDYSFLLARDHINRTYQAQNTSYLNDYEIQVNFNNEVISKEYEIGNDGTCTIKDLVYHPFINYYVFIEHSGYKNQLKRVGSDKMLDNITIDIDALGKSQSQEPSVFLLQDEMLKCELEFKVLNPNNSNPYTIEEVTLSIPKSEFEHGYYYYNPLSDPYHKIPDFDKNWKLAQEDPEITISKRDRSKIIRVIRKLSPGAIYINFYNYNSDLPVEYEFFAYDANENIDRRKLKSKDINNGVFTIDFKKLPYSIKPEDGLKLILYKPYGYDIKRKEDPWSDWKNDKIEIAVTDNNIDLYITRLPTYELIYLDIYDLFDLTKASKLIDDKIANRSDFFVFLSNKSEPIIARDSLSLKRLSNMLFMIEPEPPIAGNDLEYLKPHLKRMVLHESRRPVNFTFVFSRTFGNSAGCNMIINSHEQLKDAGINTKLISVIVNGNSEMDISNNCGMLIRGKPKFDNYFKSFNIINF